MMKLTNIIFLLLLILVNGFFETAYADGSRDLYPSGIQGNRFFMVARPQGASVFANHGRHYAYAKKGETLAVAFSGQGIRNAFIKLVDPLGNEYRIQDNIIGKIGSLPNISNRESELLGPRVGYTAYEHLIEEEGVWTIDFVPPHGEVGFAEINPADILADDEWQQNQTGNLIAAWDISVRDEMDTQWIPGRVYANVLNLYAPANTIAFEHRAFYGINYVLTKDGYIYKVHANGSNGLSFTYFVNNTGFLDGNGNSIYASSNAGYGVRVHEPNSPDVGNRYITHKIFYSQPSNDLPINARIYNRTEWLKNEIKIANVTDIKLFGADGTDNYVNLKGNKITFNTNYAGRYKITIKSNDSNIDFPQREVIFDAVVGDNEFIWDGKDADNNLVPKGTYDLKVLIGAIEGEVHFPYFDMEINPKGILLERINSDGSSEGGAIVFWDDSDITPNFVGDASNPTVNLEGINSFVNGHRWGSYQGTTGTNNSNDGTGSFSYGNNKAMDTWSYAVNVQKDIIKEVVVEVADLEVVSVLPNRDTIELNDLVQYTIKIRNNGPSDVVNGTFEYMLPLGFQIDNFTLVNNNCTTLKSRIISNNELRATLDIRNGCEATFLLTTRANNVPGETYGYVNAYAGLIRPTGYTDPDATSTTYNDNMPSSARVECSGNGCKNIKENRDVFLLEPYNERGQIALLKSARHLDTNNSGFQEPGEEIEYTFTLRNIGEVEVKDFVFTDSLLTPITTSLSGLILESGEEYTFTRKYTITQNDAQNFQVINQAYILGKNPRNFDVKDYSGTGFDNNTKTKIDIDQPPYFRLKKTVTNEGTGENKQFTIGDRIQYTLNIKHDGLVPIENVFLDDALLFDDTETLFPGPFQNTERRIVYEYIITQDDINKGIVENTATIFGTDTKYRNLLSDISGLTYDDDQKTITPLARPAIVDPDNFILYQSQDIELDILGNDTKGSSNWDLGGIEIVEPPKLGKLRMEGMRLYYKQNVNSDSGTDFFTYRIKDNSRLFSNIVRVDLEILKTVPIAENDHFIQTYNSSININPTKNDHVEYSEIDPNSIRVINSTVNGELIYQGNGIFSYQSNKTFSGIDEFTYVVQDRNGNWTDPATVKIEIAGVVIPSVITPNGDGYNDTFEIIGLYKFEQCEIQIFDRFKNIIYTNPDYKNDWSVDYTVRDGTYFYLIKAYEKDKKPVVYKGSLLINRQNIMGN